MSRRGSNQLLPALLLVLSIVASLHPAALGAAKATPSKAGAAKPTPSKAPAAKPRPVKAVESKPAPAKTRAPKPVLPDMDGEYKTTCDSSLYTPTAIVVNSAEELQRAVRETQKKHINNGLNLFVLSTQEELFLDAPLVFDLNKGGESHCLVFGVRSNNTKNSVGKPLTLRCRRATSAVIFRRALGLISRLKIEGCTDSGMRLEAGVAESIPPSINIFQVSFRNNSAKYGGAIHLAAPGVISILSGVQFFSNSADQGGAIYANSACVRVGGESQPDLKDWPNLFQNNTAMKGGAIFVDSSSCVSIYNTVGFMGSADTQTFIINGTRFEGNTASNGGAVRVEFAAGTGDNDQDTIIIRESEFRNNKAEVRGGAVSISNAVAVDMQDTKISNNSAGLSGGAMHFDSNTFGDFRLSGVQIHGNKVTYPSLPQSARATLQGEYDSAASAATLQQKLTAELGSGGAIFASGTVSVVVETSEKSSPLFALNTANNLGGAIACYRCLRLQMDSATFQDNTACSGGAVALVGLLVGSSIANSQFVNNKGSTTTSCARLNMQLGANLTPKLEDKSAACRGGGGGGLCSSSLVDLLNSTFTGNTAAIGGGAYLLQSGCTSTTCLSNISACTFQSNSATLAGGGLFISSLKQAYLPVTKAFYRQAAASRSPSPSTKHRTFEQAQVACQAAQNSSYIADSIVSSVDAASLSGSSPRHGSRTGTGSPPTTSNASLTTSSHARKLVAGTFNTKPAPVSAKPSTDSPLSNLFDNNTVVDSSGYGPAIATSAACILPAVSTPHPVVVTNNQDFGLVLNAYDAFLQLIPRQLPGADFSVSSPKDLGLTQLSTAGVVQDASAIRISSLSVNGNYGLTKLMLQGSLFGQEVGVGEVEVDIRQCQVGEVTFGNLCRRCSSGGEQEYSFNPQLATCQACPRNGACNGTSLVPRKAYWHASPRSPRIYHCPLLDACELAPKSLPPGLIASSSRSLSRDAVLLGYQQGLVANLTLSLQQTEEYVNLQCSPGYKGNVCGVCAKGYGRTGARCKRCGPQAATWVFVVLLKIAEGLFLVGMVMVRVLFRAGYNVVLPTQANLVPKPGGLARRRIIRYGKQKPQATRGPMIEVQYQQELQQQNATHDGNLFQELRRDAEAYLSTLLEMILIYVQILGLIMSTQVAWTRSVINFFTSLRFTEGTFVWLSPDCLLPSSAKHAVGFWRVGVITLTPGLVVLVVCSVWFIFTLTRPHSRLSFSWKHIFTMVSIQAANFYYPSVVSTLFSIFTCTSLDPHNTSFAGVTSRASSSHGWWKQDYDVKCFKGTHTVFSLTFGVPLLLLLAAGIPCYVMWFLWSSNKRGLLNNASHQEKFGHMYLDFEAQHYMWYGVRFALFLSLSIAVQGLSYYGAEWQLLAVASVLSTFLFVHLWCQPYRSALINSTYAFIMYGTLATVYLSIPLSEDVISTDSWTPLLMVVVNGIVVTVLLASLIPGMLKFRLHLSAFVSSAANVISGMTKRATVYKSVMESRYRDGSGARN